MAYSIRPCSKPSCKAISIIICALYLTLTSCQRKIESDKSLGEISSTTDFSGFELAQKYCSSCHTFVDPELLPKSIWRNNVLPDMGNRLGIYEHKNYRDSLLDKLCKECPIDKAVVFPENQLLSNFEWEKLVEYYLDNAPDSVSFSGRTLPINMGLKNFRYQRAGYSHSPPHTTMVKILDNGKGLVFADAKLNIKRLTFLTENLEYNYDIRFKNVPIHYFPDLDTVYLATVGETIFPQDDADGVLQKLFIEGTSTQYNAVKSIVGDLQRPVFMAYGDLNNDGSSDMVACEYGGYTGKLSWFENLGKDQFKKNVLRAQPGAIKAVLQDFNDDGNLDIMALFAQGDEGIFWYENMGDNTFKEHQLLSFSPLYGSQYFELADFNQDGSDDILYVCGDNGDKTSILKEYHGLYVFLNDGEFQFTESFFYQLNGAYKAIPRDYDEDGDLDIAAISFFPDYAGHVEESFVFLENGGNLQFTDYSFPQAKQGRWMVIDAGDLDNDGDIDLALGSHVYIPPKGDSTNLYEKWKEVGPSVVVLENTIR